MPLARLLYFFMLIVSIVFVVYVLYINFIHDPGAAEFLSRKTDLKRPVPIPVWVNVMYVHVVFACIAMLSGAVSFSSRVLNGYRKLHKIIGYVYLVSILIVVVTSGYMAPYTTGGKLNSIAFNMLNIAWPCMTIAALVQIRKKRINNHRKWMVRSYAFCFTNLFIHSITFLFSAGFGVAYTTSYTIGVYGSMLLLPVLAEIVIRTIMRIPFRTGRSEPMLPIK
jgi:hypothetical protein